MNGFQEKCKNRSVFNSIQLNLITMIYLHRHAAPRQYMRRITMIFIIFFHDQCSVLMCSFRISLLCSSKVEFISRASMNSPICFSLELALRIFIFLLVRPMCSLLLRINRYMFLPLVETKLKSRSAVIIHYYFNWLYA